jgi:hypothetical protein
MKSLPGIFWFLFGGVLLFAVDYQIKTVKILPVESYPARVSLGGVTIAADPYSTDEKSFSAFDVGNLNSCGYFPLHIIIKNDSKMLLTVRALKITLITASGQQLYTTPATIVVEDVIQSGRRKKFPLLKSNDKDLDIKTGSPLSDFTSKEITSKTIDPGSIFNGFLFFYTSTPQKNLFMGSTLIIPKLEDEGAHKTLGPFSIPLDPAFEQSKP